jgi:hypothetical protein
MEVQTPITPTPPVAPPATEVKTDPKLEGKTQAELIQMYADANKKIGEQGNELETTRKAVQDMNVILAAIGDDEELIEKIKAKIAGKDERPDSKRNKKKEEDNEPKSDPKLDDVRKVSEMEIVRKFESDTGISELSGDKRKEMNEKIGSVLWELADPEDRYKTFEEMRSHIPLSKLNGMLQRAYLIANQDKLNVKEGENYRPVLGPFGSMSSSKHMSEMENDNVELTEKQKEIAEKQGISLEKITARLKEIKKEKTGK